MTTTPSSGVYVHVPFCAHRCPFCAFAVTTRVDGIDAWLGGVLRELELRAPSWAFPVGTIYLGGGTPSLLPVGHVVRLLDALRTHLHVTDGAELCLESHPGHLDGAALRTLVAAGLTRLSIGVQSFDDDDLALLGRDHTARQAQQSLDAARAAGVPSVSIDLIHGLPGRDLVHWDAQLTRAIALGPDHIAAYALTFEPDTPFTARRDRGELVAPTSDEEAALFVHTHERLAAAGYAPYEASNFARDRAHRCRHNEGYWRRRPYLGLGPSAHAFDGERRWTNARRLPDWLRHLAEAEAPTASEEALTADDVTLERLFLGLRTAHGVELTSDEHEHLSRRIDQLVEDGLAHRDGPRLVLTTRGLAVAEDVATSLAARLPPDTAMASAQRSA